MMRSTTIPTSYQIALPTTPSKPVSKSAPSYRTDGTGGLTTHSSLSAWTTQHRTRHTSVQQLASPKLIRTTPSSRPAASSRARSVGGCLESPFPSTAMRLPRESKVAAPPGLHMHPVRRAMPFAAACAATVESGMGSPLSYIGRSEGFISTLDSTNYELMNHIHQT